MTGQAAPTRRSLKWAWPGRPVTLSHLPTIPNPACVSAFPPLTNPARNAWPQPWALSGSSEPRQGGTKLPGRTKGTDPSELSLGTRGFTFSTTPGS